MKRHVKWHNEPFFEIPYYHDYLSPTFAAELLKQAQPVLGVEELLAVGPGGGLESLESNDSLRFLVSLYEQVQPELARVLGQRKIDRKFIDERARACSLFNSEYSRGISSPDYVTVLGLEDENGRIVFGPRIQSSKKNKTPVAPLPDYLQGPHVTLFGPPDSAKIALNAMNSYHRKTVNEPACVEEILKRSPYSPMWGADSEDSKTPLRSDLIDAGVNLTACCEGSGEITSDHRALPIKRFPGLALPCAFLFYRKNPIPLHLYDFALHLFRNWDNPKALTFYVPKLENEEEAAYIHSMISAAESAIIKLHPAYRAGSVRLMIVLENPRAILRIHEIIDALHPYFAGASLGWHDFIASTGRLFKEDSHYRMPVKSDPNIVINHIHASHRLLTETVGSRGGIPVGGMYGVLPVANHAESLQITMRGFFKDVLTQLKRGLSGFWVAHPDFVRLGLAMVQAWDERQKGDPTSLKRLIQDVLDPKFHAEVFSFIEKPDHAHLSPSDPGYLRALIVADIEESKTVHNNDPEEIRYNVFQALQYLADWLSGKGCVALPTTIDGVPVRVMDDLATTERSRWEVWAEIHHGRFRVEDFLRIAHEEMNFIRRDLSNGTKIVQVKWSEQTTKWYPIAFRIMLQLMTDPEPVEFATELLLPLTVEEIRHSSDPWNELQMLDARKYRLPRAVERLNHYFEVCGVERFAEEMAKNIIEDQALAEKIVLSFSKQELLKAASFHGDIGQSKSTLDARAAAEQALVSSDAESVQVELRTMGAAYLKKFGFKFLISAQGRSADELLSELKRRMGRDQATEEQEARRALWEISKKRLATPLDNPIDRLLKKHGVTGASVAINQGTHTQNITAGESVKTRAPVLPGTRFELASLSKTVASAYALEYFRNKKIPITASVNSLFERTDSSFRLTSPKNAEWANQVTLAHLMGHSALNMHYVRGFQVSEKLPPLTELLAGKHGYEPVEALNEPGSEFHYSGGGFLVLEHLIESLEKKPIAQLIRPFMESLGFRSEQPIANGYFDDGKEVPGGRLNFPTFAAGMLGSAQDMAVFLRNLSNAYHRLEGVPGLSHDTAVQMLHAKDLGCQAFMGCRMGLGVFVVEASRNRFAIHQGANEGFRALYLHCYSGPDQGSGFVILCNGDNRGVLFISELAQELLAALEIEGIDYGKFKGDFKFQGLAQEQIVNLGYKALLFDAFEPDLPERLVTLGARDPLASQNLAVGAKILSVTNQKFARAENLLSPFEPVFDPVLFGRQGKIMDSWETARHNPLKSDRLELELIQPSGQASTIRYIRLSTKYHDGNQAEAVRIEGFTAHGQTVELLPRTAMTGHSLLQIDLGEASAIGNGEIARVTVEIYPDGGLSRLGLFKSLSKADAEPFKLLSDARCVRFQEPIPKALKPLTIPVKAANLAFGNSVVSASNEHYGPASQVISPFPPLHMFDGLESARSRKPGHFEEVVLKLGKAMRIEGVIFDFTYFVNNNPVAISIDGLFDGEWIALAQKTPVKAFAGNKKMIPIAHGGIFREIRVRTYPDGGINRIKVLGSSAPA